jgi:hypothetical protein
MPQHVLRDTSSRGFACRLRSGCHVCAQPMYVHMDAPMPQGQPSCRRPCVTMSLLAAVMGLCGHLLQ